MSTVKAGEEGEQTQQGLFGMGDLPAGTAAAEPTKAGGAARVMSPVRNQESMRSCGVATCSRLKTKAAECVA